jgi:hypothetical protein
MRQLALATSKLGLGWIDHSQVSRYISRTLTVGPSSWKATGVQRRLWKSGLLERRKGKIMGGGTETTWRLSRRGYDAIGEPYPAWRTDAEALGG